MSRQVRSVQFDITTTAGGAATVRSAPVDGPVRHVLYDGGLDAGASLTITGNVTGLVVFTSSSTAKAAAMWSPRTPTHAASDASASLYAGSGEPVEDCVYVPNEDLKLVVASGGNAKTGTVTVVYG